MANAPEKETLQKKCGYINRAIADKVELATYGSCLSSLNFLPANTASCILSVGADSVMAKATKLTNAATTHITQAGSQADITREFNNYLEMLWEDLELKDVARQLTDTNKDLAAARNIPYLAPPSLASGGHSNEAPPTRETSSNVHSARSENALPGGHSNEAPPTRETSSNVHAARSENALPGPVASGGTNVCTDGIADQSSQEAAGEGSSVTPLSEDLPQELYTDYMENDSSVRLRKKNSFTKDLVFNGIKDLKDCNSKCLNGNGIRMAIIDFKGNICNSDALKISKDPDRIKIIDTETTKSPENEYKEHAYHSAVIAAGDSCPTEVAAGMATYPGGIASGAKVDVFLVHRLDRSTTVEALKQIVEGDYDVLSVSIGSPFFTDPVWDKRISELKNTIIVAAAGNDSSSMRPSPSTNPSVISVGSVSYGNSISYFSPSNADVYCYGEVKVINSDGTFTKNSRGTSLSTPAVAGLVCLILQIIKKNKEKIEITPVLVKAILQKMFCYSSNAIQNNAVPILRSLATDLKIFLKDHRLESRRLPKI